ncbi:MAG: hypothetical protein HN431_15560, partial [Bacteroidetes bacterium]|nr:hypothetical protein [Bacteroidota bacterium]
VLIHNQIYDFGQSLIYTLEFFIEDVPELREKFPTQFEKAFDNWDYIVDTYSKYLEDNK